MILVTGANGQIGTVLVQELRKVYGKDNVIASDINPSDLDGPFELLDITEPDNILSVIRQYRVTQIYHLAALLSSKGEVKPHLTWRINLSAYLDILELARQENIGRIFFPSTIGIYGPTTPKIDTPQHTSFEPKTVYGITKWTGELWGQYYKDRYGLDIRSIRYPGVISYQSIPEGGTTDYAVEMFFDAKLHGHYTCYLSAETRLPMIYMPDVISATLQLMDAPASDISLAMGYNIAGFSITPSELSEAITEHLPLFSIDYKPDERQKIADSWSDSIDDSRARKDWNWSPNYDLAAMTKDMLDNIDI